MKKALKLFIFILNKSARKILYIKANSFIYKKFPEISKSYQQFKEFGQISSNRQPIKGYDLWKLLNKYSPKNIVELGSGTTSAIFALYSKTNNSNYIAFESHLNWLNVTQNSISKISLHQNDIQFVKTEINEIGTATHFCKIIPNNVDFLYIDGPPCTLDNGKKVPNDDIIIAFANNILPKYIVIDGRHETVELILNHNYSNLFNFYPSLNYSINKNLFTQALYCREHSVFIKK
jgi:hypothetical protein